MSEDPAYSSHSTFFNHQDFSNFQESTFDTPESVKQPKRLRLGNDALPHGLVCTSCVLCPGSLVTTSSGTTSDRLAELSALVTRCTHDELVHLNKAIEPLLKRDFLVHLPIEISLHILSYLSLRDILRCAQVSIRWNRIASDAVIWHRLCKRDGIADTCSSLTRPTDRAKCAVRNSSGSTDECYSNVSCASQMPLHDWKAIYRHSLEIRCNWLHGSAWSPVVLGAHHNHVITCLEVYNDWAISGSDDSSICIWDLTRGDLLINLFGHIGGVWSLSVLPPENPEGTPLLVSGSCDRTARVWSLDGSRWPCLTTLFGHQSTVRCLAGQRQVPVDGFSSDQKETESQKESDLCVSRQQLVVTGSRDTTLRLWDALSGHCLHVLQGHRGAVRCVQFCGSLIVSGSYDCTIRVWSSDTGECIHVLNEHTNRVYKLLFDGSRIISASLDTTICVWNVQTGTLRHKFCGHQSLTSEMAYGRSQRILVSSNADETIRVWDVETGECLHVLAGRHKHASAVTCVQLTRHFIISSGDDGIVKLWDRRTGNYIRDLVRLDGASRGGVIWRIVASDFRLVCAAGSRNGLETTKLIILRFGNQDLEQGTQHSCRSRTLPAPLPKLSTVVAAYAFETEPDAMATASSSVQ